LGAIDCIETELDEFGQLHGFTLRSEFVSLMHFKEDYDLRNVLKMIRTVNLMNRLLLNGEIKKKEVIPLKTITN